MSEELQAKLVEYLNSSKDFLAEELPLFAQELLMCRWVEHSISLGFGIFAVLVCAIYLCKWGKNGFRDFDHPAWFLGNCTAAILILAGIVGTINDTTALAKIKYAPKVVLMEEIRGMK